MPEVLFDEPPSAPRWARLVPFGLLLVALLGFVASIFQGESRLPDSPAGWSLVGVAALGLVAWFAIEAADLSWLPGGRDGVRIDTAALHLGEARFELDELTGEASWEPATPQHLELAMTHGDTLPVDTARPDELRAALRRAKSTPTPTPSRPSPPT